MKSVLDSTAGSPLSPVPAVVLVKPSPATSVKWSTALQQIPLKRVADPDKMAGAVPSLASDAPAIPPRFR